MRFRLKSEIREGEGIGKKRKKETVGYVDGQRKCENMWWRYV